MTVNDKGRIAVTHVKRLNAVDVGTLVAVRLETGRTHQIRAHLLAIGCPVVGDNMYGSKQPDLPLQLHAAYLKFMHPVSGEVVEVYAEPPEDFRAEVQREWVAEF
jgi:23S rRNA pseudouridine1911/1915/1917 synthase